MRHLGEGEEKRELCLRFAIAWDIASAFGCFSLCLDMNGWNNGWIDGPLSFKAGLLAIAYFQFHCTK